MQQEELQQIQKWCQQSEDAILFYAPDGTLLWQNDAAAVRQKPQNSSLPRYHKNGAPEDGMFCSGRAAVCTASGRSRGSTAKSGNTGADPQPAGRRSSLERCRQAA